MDDMEMMNMDRWSFGVKMSLLLNFYGKRAWVWFDSFGSCFDSLGIFYGWKAWITGVDGYIRIRGSTWRQYLVLYYMHTMSV